MPRAHDAPAGGEEAHIGGQIHAHDKFVHQIRTFTVRQLEGAGDDVLGAVVYGRLGAQAADEVRLGGSGHRADDACAEGDGELHGC